MRNHRQIVAELALENGDVADVIHAFIEATTKFGRDGLKRNLRVTERGQNNQQFRRRLRRVGFVHRNFGDEIFVAFFFGDAIVNRARAAHGGQIFGGDFRHLFARGFKRRFDAVNRNFSDQFGMTIQEFLYLRIVNFATDKISDIERKKVGAGDKFVHGFQPNMIGVHIIWLIPTQLFRGGIGGIAQRLRFGTDCRVFAVRFVPNRRDLDAALQQHLKRAQLRAGLMGETVADAKRKGFDYHNFRKVGLEYGAKLSAREREVYNANALSFWRACYSENMQHHQMAPGQAAHQLDLPLVLPGVESEDDGCITRLETRLREQTGIASAHFDKNASGQSVVCLHYDPNLVSLEKLERMARDTGTEITDRFRHETLGVKGMDCASCAASIEHIVAKVTGVTHVRVNYPTEKLKVEYDSSLTSRDAIVRAVSKLGYRVPGATTQVRVPKPVHDHAHCDGNHDHGEHEGHEHNHAHEENDEHGADDGHDHGSEADANAPWLLRNRELALSLASGVLLALGFFGEHFFGFPFVVALGFYLAAYVAGGLNLARHAIPTVLSGRFDVEFLMLLGAVGAGILGDWAEGAFLLFLFSLGHALEHYAMSSARQAIRALGDLTPKTARVMRDGREIEAPIETLRVGEIVVARAGDRVPVDGVIKSGNSSVDQSPITGESVPVEKEIGADVFAGTINGDGVLEIEVTKLSSDSTIARVQKMVEEAQAQKAPSQTFADSFEAVFVPTILVVVVLAAIVPPLLGWLSWPVAFLRAISTLVAASPCALALATPSAVLAGIARAAGNGVLIKGGVHLENLGNLRAIAFDKTGTLTLGHPEVADIIAAPGVAARELMQVAASVEARSSHPLAQAVTRRAQSDGLNLSAVGDLQTFKGRGVQAEMNGQIVRIGNARLMEESEIKVPAELLSQLQTLGASGKPTMIVARDAQVLGVLALADPIRPEAKSTLEQLRQIGIGHLVMLTGDNEKVALHMAPLVGVTDVRADLLPEHKVGAIKQLQTEFGGVAMIGDGVNDAPALANADVGIAMGAGGADVALETADVALMADDLSKLPFAVGLSRQAKNIIRQNLWISLGVIALLVPSTLFGFARLGVAVIFHEGSTLIVVLNALRLLRYRAR